LEWFFLLERVIDMVRYTGQIVEVSWNYDKGHLKLNLDEFFPASQNKVKQLMNKIIKLDYAHRDDIKEQLLTYLDESIIQMEQDWKNASKLYLEKNQKLVDLGNIIKSGKLPNGVPLKKAELKEQKEHYKSLKQGVQSILQTVKTAKNALDKYKRNKQTLEELGW